MIELNLEAITLDPIEAPVLQFKKVKAEVLRLDKLHSYISGNKWFKLRYYLEEAEKKNLKRILTFGGAWSNHLLAVAAACEMNKMESIGIIRGEEPFELSTTLQQAKLMGMKLFFISREDYQKKKIPDAVKRYKFLKVDEGGMGAKGVKGAGTILDLIHKNKYDQIVCAVGTGTMLAGLVKNGRPQFKYTGINVLKNPGINEQINKLLRSEASNYEILHQYHFGGYAKKNEDLITFMNAYYKLTNIPTDFVYTGKLFYAFNDLVHGDYFKKRSRVLVIHSGGLQGNNSLPKGTLIF